MYNHRSLFPRVFSLGLLCALSTHCLPAHAWGEKGHAIVGGIADARIGARARDQVKEILGGQSLTSVASWPDYVRHLQPGFEPPKDHPELATDQDSVDFVNQFFETKNPEPGHVLGGSASWHITRLPLDAEGYDAVGMAENFGGEPLREDVVMRIQSCIALLQSDAPIHGPWGKRNALRTLVHLVGDLHMPLHVGVGYVDPDATDLNRFLVKDAATVETRHLKSDSNANALLIPQGEKCISLHAFWDERMPDRVVQDALDAHRIEAGASQQETTTHYASLLAQLPVQPNWNATGEIKTWPAQWTRDSMNAARAAYDGVQVTSSAKVTLENNYEKKSTGYPIKVSDGYEDKMAPIAESQLAMGGYRLARVLDTIWQ